MTLSVCVRPFDTPLHKFFCEIAPSETKCNRKREYQPAKQNRKRHNDRVLCNTELLETDSDSKDHDQNLHSKGNQSSRGYFGVNSCQQHASSCGFAQEISSNEYEYGNHHIR